MNKYDIPMIPLIKHTSKKKKKRFQNQIQNDELIWHSNDTIQIDVTTGNENKHSEMKWNPYRYKHYTMSQTKAMIVKLELQLK